MVHIWLTLLLHANTVIDNLIKEGVSLFQAQTFKWNYLTFSQRSAYMYHISPCSPCHRLSKSMYNFHLVAMVTLQCFWLAKHGCRSNSKTKNRNLVDQGLVEKVLKMKYIAFTSFYLKSPLEAGRASPYSHLSIRLKFKLKTTNFHNFVNDRCKKISSVCFHVFQNVDRPRRCFLAKIAQCKGVMTSYKIQIQITDI